MHTERTDTHSAGWAAVLSLIIPGVGQIYNGDFLRGIFWLIVTPGFWIGSGGTLGWICHVISALTAYRRSRLYQQFPNWAPRERRRLPITP